MPAKPAWRKALKSLSTVSWRATSYMSELANGDGATRANSRTKRPLPGLVSYISDGPDEDFEKLRWTLLGALSIARYSVRIVTPYFLPDPPLVSALNLAAMRGVQVDIILPSTSNLPFVRWASRAMWWQVLKHGCRIWLTPPPFDHSKLMVVDDHPAFRIGLTALINSQPDMVVVAETGDGRGLHPSHSECHYHCIWNAMRGSRPGRIDVT